MNMEDVTVRRRITVMIWLLPLSLALLLVLFHLGPDRWLRDNGIVSNPNVVATLFYATAVPVLVFWMLRQIGHWLDETNQSQSQVQAKAERSAQITNSSADAILSLDAQGLIDTWNDGAEGLFGFEAASAHGHPFSDLLGGSEAAQVE